MILQKRTSRVMIRNYQFGARGSYVSEFEMEDCDLVQLGKQWSMEQITQWMSNEIF